MSDDDVIDIRRPIEVIASCPQCGTERRLPPDWRQLLGLSAGPGWDGKLRCRNDHEPVEMTTRTVAS